MLEFLKYGTWENRVILMQQASFLCEKQKGM